MCVCVHTKMCAHTHTYTHNWDILNHYTYLYLWNFNWEVNGFHLVGRISSSWNPKASIIVAQRDKSVCGFRVFRGCISCDCSRFEIIVIYGSNTHTHTHTHKWPSVTYEALTTKPTSRTTLLNLSSDDSIKLSASSWCTSRHPIIQPSCTLKIDQK